jgi:hypothetical protein
LCRMLDGSFSISLDLHMHDGSDPMLPNQAFQANAKIVRLKRLLVLRNNDRKM